MPEALVLGELCIDVIVFNPRSVPVMEIPMWSEDIEIRLGGSASYTAQGLHTLGLGVTVDSLVGDEPLTAALLEKLAQPGIRLDHVRVDPGVRTPTCVSQSDQGAKSFFSCSPLTEFPLDLLEVPLDSFDLVYFGGYLLYPSLWGGGLGSMLARVPEETLVVVDTQILPTPANVYLEQALLPETMRHVDVLLVDQDESRTLTGERDAEKAARNLHALGPGMVVVKLGGDGCLVWNGEQCLRSRSMPVDVCNPVGAGDLFGAGFCHALLQRWSLQRASDFAATFAGLCISRRQKPLPDEQEVLRFLP